MANPVQTQSRPDVAASLLAWARARGAQVAWGGVEAVLAASQELQRRRRAGEIDPEVDATHLSELSDEAPPAWAKRVVVFALPRPAHRVRVHGPAGPRSLLLPPTYLRYRPVFEEVRRELLAAAGALPDDASQTASVQSSGAAAGRGVPIPQETSTSPRIEICAGPLKSVAARLGLVEYGRNNVAYAGAAGSYIQLLGYFTDAALPLPAGWTPRAPRLMSDCDGCSACLLACPTQAIGSDRVLLHTERCLTSVNELPGEWPARIPRRAHHTLVGCLRCQVRCPRNPKLPIEEAGIALTAGETAALLAGEVPPSVHDKLERIGQPHLAPALPRNVAAVLRPGTGSRAPSTARSAR